MNKNKVKVKLIFLYFILFHLFFLIVLILINPYLWLKYLVLVLISVICNGYLMNKLLNKEVENINKYNSLENTISVMDKTIPYFRQGLNDNTAYEIASIIKNISNSPAVAITDKNNVLAFVGVGCDKHPTGYPIRTQATLDAINSGEIKVIRKKEDFNCKIKDCNCPLEAAIIIPLFSNKDVIGSLKFYQTKKGATVTEEQVKFASGMGKLLNIQLELSELDRQTQLAIAAKLDALQAQVNPHFLFNALNTINMYIIKDQEYARKLVVKLSMLLRYLLGNYGRYISIEEEIKYIKDYAVFENARFEDKLKIEFDIEKSIMDVKIPIFTIQPLVQNSIAHGLLPKEEGGTVKVSAKNINNEILITVEDDGIGIKESEINKIFGAGYGKGLGIGISNVNERIKLIYGKRHELKIISTYGVGTKAYFSIPL